MQLTDFLKRVLMLDAISCLALGIGLALGAAALAPVLGLRQDLLLGAGLLLMPIALYIGCVARRRQIASVFVYAVIAGNLHWVAESVIVAANADEITWLGTLFVIGQAAAVSVITLLEIVGIAGSRSAGPAGVGAAA